MKSLKKLSRKELTDQVFSILNNGVDLDILSEIMLDKIGWKLLEQNINKLEDTESFEYFLKYTNVLFNIHCELLESGHFEYDEEWKEVCCGVCIGVGDRVRRNAKFEVKVYEYYKSIGKEF